MVYIGTTNYLIMILQYLIFPSIIIHEGFNSIQLNNMRVGPSDQWLMLKLKWTICNIPKQLMNKNLTQDCNMFLTKYNHVGGVGGVCSICWSKSSASRLYQSIYRPGQEMVPFEFTNTYHFDLTRFENLSTLHRLAHSAVYIPTQGPVSLPCLRRENSKVYKFKIGVNNAENYC